jgi:ribosomal protein L7Ae-like RNA K-turn-binding protein
VDAAVVKRVMRLIGLGVRSRGAIVGVERVREGVRKGNVTLAVVASDASQNSLSKVLPLLEARRVHIVNAPSAAELGEAVGREQTAVVGIVDKELARGIRAVTDAAPDRGRRSSV